MAEKDIIIKKLEAANLDQVSRFRMSGESDKPLQHFIRRDAKKSSAALLTQTYVAKVEGERQVIGYISIMCAEIKLEDAYSIEDKVGADKYEFQPAVRIARLAVQDDFRGKKIGKALVETAIGITQTSIAPNAGCRFIILDAKKKSIAFYQRMGFRLLDTTENKSKPTPLMFMDMRGLAA